MEFSSVLDWILTYGYGIIFFGTLVVGTAVGAQFLATVLTRSIAGRRADHRGAKRTMCAGLVSCVVAGGVYVASATAPAGPGARLALLVAAPVCMGLAWAIERYAYRPLRHAPKLAPLISAIGVSILLQNLAMMIWGRSYFSFPSFMKVTTYEVAGASITDLQVGIVLLATALMAGLLWLVHRTRLGLAMRATAPSCSSTSFMISPSEK